MQTIFTKTAVLSTAGAMAVMLAGAAQAAFQGRNASNEVDNTCTVSGTTKCTSFYDTTLDITILNNWNIGIGFWSDTAAPGSAQFVAAAAGAAATGLTGWVLPTGKGSSPAGAANQISSIWSDSGGSFSSLSSKFDGVIHGNYGGYWSSSRNGPDFAWRFNLYTDLEQIPPQPSYLAYYAVAVRPGDVAAVPEPQTSAMLLLGLGSLVVARKRRPS